MINKSKLGGLALVAMMGIATPAFAQNLATDTIGAYGRNSPQATAVAGGSRGLHASVPQHRSNVAPDRPLYNLAPNAGIVSPANPIDNPSLTGGGSAGYNECAGHPRC